MAGERGNEEAKKKKEWNDGDATLHSMPASRILPHYGTVRMARDSFHISGFLLIDACGQVVQIVLNQAAPLASALVDPLRKLLLCAQVAVNLG